ncbi:hypothetical protein HY214_00560 [Candidatus Roizmanbacteria bacterium]|nr:hypothetical protein [Candidatus Roizmanbacteria bacterium]
MLSERLRTTFSDIASEAIEMVSLNVDKEDLAKGINYVSIYAQTQEEFSSVARELKDNGTVALQRSSGDYYKLTEPLKISAITISHCRVRVFDDDHPERGYIDFEVKNYKKFKEKYLSKPHFLLISSGEEMIELRDPKFSVRAYFPSGNF